MEIVDALDQVWSGVTSLLDEIDEASWQRPTPCVGWTVHDVAAHLGHLEGIGHGFPQPDPPPGYDPAVFTGLQAVTEEGVAARRSWSPEEVVDEIRRASATTLNALRGYGPADWEAPVPSPVGTVPARQAAEIRLADAYVHLLDIRHALGRPLETADVATASEAVVGRALRVAGWGAVKQAELRDGSRIRLDLLGRGAVELVVEGRRGRLAEPEADTVDRIAGSPLAFLLAVSGRSEMAEAAGGLEVTGEAAARFLAGYRLFL